MAERSSQKPDVEDAVERWKKIAESNELRAREAEARVRFAEAELQIAELSAKLASIKKQK